MCWIFALLKELQLNVLGIGSIETAYNSPQRHSRTILTESFYLRAPATIRDPRLRFAGLDDEAQWLTCACGSGGGVLHAGPVCELN